MFTSSISTRSFRPWEEESLRRPQAPLLDLFLDGIFPQPHGFHTPGFGEEVPAIDGRFNAPAQRRDTYAPPGLFAGRSRRRALDHPPFRPTAQVEARPDLNLDARSGNRQIPHRAAVGSGGGADRRASAEAVSGSGTRAGAGEKRPVAPFPDSLVQSGFEAPERAQVRKVLNNPSAASETGALVDVLGLTEGRDDIWNSEGHPGGHNSNKQVAWMSEGQRAAVRGASDRMGARAGYGLSWGAVGPSLVATVRPNSHSPKDRLYESDSLRLSHRFPSGVRPTSDRLLVDGRTKKSGRVSSAPTKPHSALPYLSSLHNEVVNLAQRFPPSPGTREWTVGDLVSWQMGKADIFEFKRQWVRGYRNAIKAAAARFDLPAELVAGAAFAEVGGDPLFVDGLAYGLRSSQGRDRTSFGNVSIQVRRAAQALGYRTDRELSPSQRRMIITSLKQPQTNIMIAAKHLADLRDRDFKGVSAAHLTKRQVEVIATRYNRGPDLPIKYIERNMSYGRSISKRWKELRDLIQ